MHQTKQKLSNYMDCTVQIEILQSYSVFQVEFYAAWSPTSIHLEPVFAEISLRQKHFLSKRTKKKDLCFFRYGTECLRFAKVDLSRWPGIGKDYNIDLSGASPQVPSFILFENGVESARIPHVYPDGSVAKGKYRKVRLSSRKLVWGQLWSQIDLVRGFELDMRYAKTLGKKENKKKDQFWTFPCKCRLCSPFQIRLIRLTVASRTRNHLRQTSPAAQFTSDEVEWKASVTVPTVCSQFQFDKRFVRNATVLLYSSWYFRIVSYYSTKSTYCFLQSRQ